MKRKGIWVVVSVLVVLGLLLGGFACTPTPTPAPTPTPTPTPEVKEPLKIGTILNFTGPIADMGPQFLVGIELALEEANYEVAGRQIELIVEDAASSVTVPLEKLKKLVEADGVRISIGPLMGDAHLAVAAYAAEQKVLMTTLFNGMIQVVPYGNWIIYPTTTFANKVPGGWYAYDEMGARTMVTVGADYAGGHGFISGGVYGFEERGGTVVQQLWPPIGLADWGPYLSIIEDADVLTHFLAGDMAAARFEEAYLESGLEMPLFHQTQDSHHSPTILAEYGARLLGIKGIGSYDLSSDAPVNKEFVAAFKAKTGTEPNASNQHAYTLTRVILAGLEATGGDDSFDKLWPAVLALKMDTPQGPLSFSPNGLAITDVHIFQVQMVGDKYELVRLKTYPAVTDPRLE